MIHIGVIVHGIPTDKVIIGQITIRIIGGDMGMVITTGIIISIATLIMINVIGIVVEVNMETETAIVAGTIPTMITDILMEFRIQSAELKRRLQRNEL